jgi:hypothetical protein
MYQLTIAFFSTVVLTAVLTKWFYPGKPKPFVDPSKIPIISNDKHNEYMELKRQWALKNNPIRAP